MRMCPALATLASPPRRVLLELLDSMDGRNFLLVRTHFYFLTSHRRARLFSQHTEFY